MGLSFHWRKFVVHCIFGFSLLKTMQSNTIFAQAWQNSLGQNFSLTFSDFQNDIYFPAAVQDKDVDNIYAEAAELALFQEPKTRAVAQGLLIKNLQSQYDHLPSLLLLADMMITNVDHDPQTFPKLQSAITLINHVLEKDPKNLQAQQHILRIFSLLGYSIDDSTKMTSTKTANTFLHEKEACCITPDHIFWAQKGESLFQNGQIQKSKQAFEKSIALGNHINGKLGLGVLEYKKRNHPKRAQKLFTDLIHYFDGKKYFPAQFYAIVYSHLSLVYLKLKDQNNFQDTLKKLAYFEALSEEKYTPSLVFEYRSLHQEKFLIGYLQECLKHDPFYAAGYADLADIYIDQGQWDKALERIDQSVLLAPHNMEFLEKRGRLHYLKRDYGQALLDYQTALKIQPDKAENFYNLACVLNLLGKKEESQKNLEAALQRDESLRFVAKKDPDLKGLRVEAQTKKL